jgi:hypothetical protein
MLNFDKILKTKFGRIRFQANDLRVKTNNSTLKIKGEIYCEIFWLLHVNVNILLSEID